MHPLPIDDHYQEFQKALKNGHVVVTADTGSGKSTRLPVWASERSPTLVIEPRRVACTALAGYLAQQQGSEPGDQVGYAIRFDARYRAATPLIFATPGMALRWLSQGELERFGTIILDEFHERRWDTDLLLALLRHSSRHRLVVTSATLAGEDLSEYLEAPLIQAEGRRYPVSVRHQARESHDMPDSRKLAERIAAAVRHNLKETDGQILVFLPGRGEINDAANALRDLALPVQPLHASASNEEQRAALADDGRQRVILSTNVAETSLTIPGVTAVIDSGLERRTHQRNGRTVLTLAPISRAAADQRSGRAGRTAPGTALRLWGEHAPLDERTPPEVQREELTELVLAAACSGVPVHELSFPDPLPGKSLNSALEQLHRMGAIDHEGLATTHGHRLFSLPIDSFFAHLISSMPDATTQAGMVDLTAALSTRPRLFRFPDKEDQRRALGDWLPDPCDATTLINMLRQQPPGPLATHQNARREARTLAGRIRETLELPAIPDEPLADRDALMSAILKAAPELAFIRREKRRQAMGNDQREVIPDEASRFPEDSEAALVLDEHSTPGKRGHRQTITIATCLAPIPLDWLSLAGLGDVRMGPVTIEDGEPRAIQERHYAGRVIERRETTPSGAPLRRALADLILRGELLEPAGEQLESDVAQWSLYVGLGHANGEVPESPAAWLEAELEHLGVEETGDETLLEPEDLRFEGIPEWERERFDRQYPRRISLGDLVVDVSYQPSLKRITLDYRHGTRKAEPKRWELPAWQGWKVRYRRASRVVDVR